MSQLTEGTYRVIVEADGYETVFIEKVVIKTGKMTRFNIKLGRWRWRWRRKRDGTRISTGATNLNGFLSTRIAQITRIIRIGFFLFF